MPNFTPPSFYPGFQAPDLGNTLDSVFNAYMASKLNQRQDTVLKLQQETANQAAKKAAQETAALSATQTAQFGAPLTEFNQGEMTAAAGMKADASGQFLPQPSAPGTMNYQETPQQAPAVDPRMARLAQGLAQLRGKPELDTKLKTAQIGKTEAEGELAAGQAKYFQGISAGDGQPTVQTIGGVQYLVTPGPKGPTFSAVPERQPNQSEFIARGYADKASEANTALETMIQGGFSGTSLAAGVQTLLPNFMQSTNVQALENAKKMFGNAIARRESGATIKDDEMARYNATYFPQAGDAPELLAQKKRNRELAIAGLATEGKRVKSQLKPVAAAPDNIITRKLSDGTTVRVRPLGNGKYEEVP